jgi:non-ribosomal peptide synthetase component F
MDRLQNLERINLPLDFPRPAQLTFAGDRVSMDLKTGSCQALKAASIEWNITEYTILLAVVKVFLYRVTLQEDLIVITPTTGRHHPDLENQIGFYINNLVSRSLIEPEATFKAFLGTVDAEIKRDFMHQAYPFDLLLEDLNVPRETNRLALIDFGFTWNMYDEKQQRSGNDDQSFDTGLRTAKTDLWLYASQYADGIRFEFEYNVALFRRETVQLLLDVLLELIDNVLENPHLKLNQTIAPVEAQSAVNDARVESMFDFEF